MNKKIFQKKIKIIFFVWQNEKSSFKTLRQNIFYSFQTFQIETMNFSTTQNC
jgi:hypothetical protein